MSAARIRRRPGFRAVARRPIIASTMASPFPGMDPYLEDPAGWPGVHLLLLGTLHEHLAAAVGPGYVVRIEERVYVTDPVADVGYAALVPDLFVTRRDAAHATQGASGSHRAPTPPVVIEALAEPEVRDRQLQIHDARSDAVVAAIELLSPANKVPGGRGRLAMLAKRDLLRSGGAHWMEIDLLRAGERDPELAHRADYCIALWPADAARILAWFVDLRDRLPVVAVPLRPPDGEVLLDLQAALDTTYERARFATSVDYDRPIPAPAPAAADRAWIERTLAAWREARTAG